MKKKEIVLSIIGILLVGGVLFVITNKNTKKTFIQDGVLFAVKLDGVSQNSFPSGNNYYVDIDCTNARGRWMRAPSTNGGSDDAYRIVIDNVTGKVECNVDFQTNPSTLRDTIIGLITSGNIYEHKDQSNNTDWVLENVTDSGTNSNNDTVTAGYRYEGKKPNNYVWFNNEMWRIIGVIPTCISSGCTTTENLVKIIRTEPIGGLQWGLSATNLWGNANSLYQLLNNYYLIKGNATGANICVGYGDAKGDCDYRVVGIGETSYYGNMIKNVYWNTGLGLNTDTASATYGKEILTQNIGGKIGIMNASDYGYATTTHSREWSYYGVYASTNWLYGQGYEWTITPSSAYNDYVLYINTDGRIYGMGVTGSGRAIRPVVYLDSSVYVASGDGSEANPYQIAMASN